MNLLWRYYQRIMADAFPKFSATRYSAIVVLEADTHADLLQKSVICHLPSVIKDFYVPKLSRRRRFQRRKKTNGNVWATVETSLPWKGLAPKHGWCTQSGYCHLSWLSLRKTEVGISATLETSLPWNSLEGVSKWAHPLFEFYFQQSRA